MKDRSTDVLRGVVSINLSVPSTIEEFDNSVGEVGSALDSAIDDTIYRNTLPRLYRRAAALFTEQKDETGTSVFARAKTGSKPGKEEGKTIDVFEADIPFLTRLWNTGDDEQKKKVAEALQTVAKDLPFYDGRAAGTGGKIPASYLNNANTFFEKGEEEVDRVVSKIEGFVPGYKVTRDGEGNVTPETLARGIQALNAHIAAKQKAEAAAVLA